MSGNSALYDPLELIPSTFFVKLITGKVVVTHSGIVRLSIDGVGGV